MTLRFTEHCGSLIITMPPELDIAEAESVRQELLSLCRTGLSTERTASVIVDWSSAPFVTCAGVAVLEDFHHRVRAAGLPMRLVTSRCLPRRVLRVLGLDGALPVYDTLDEALAGGTPPGPPGLRTTTAEADQPGDTDRPRGTG